MSKVIVFCGLSGSGKTTLAKEVSKKLNMFCLHKDAIKERLYVRLGGKTLEDSQKLGRAVIELLFRLTEDSLQSNIDVMIESPFNHEDNPKEFRRWVEKYGVDLRVIVCTVNEEERMRRFTTRERHAAHRDGERLQKRQFMQDSFDYSIMPGKKLVLDTSEPLPVLVEKTLDFVK